MILSRRGACFSYTLASSGAFPRPVHALCSLRALRAPVAKRSILGSDLTSPIPKRARSADSMAEEHQQASLVADTAPDPDRPIYHVMPWQVQTARRSHAVKSFHVDKTRC